MSQAPAAAIVTVEGAEFSLARHRERQITDTAVVSFFALQKILSADGKISLSIANRCAIAGISLARLSPPQKNTRLAPGAFLWRRGGDSNSRSGITRTHDFQSCALDQLSHLSNTTILLYYFFSRLSRAFREKNPCFSMFLGAICKNRFLPCRSVETGPHGISRRSCGQSPAREPAGRRSRKRAPFPLPESSDEAETVNRSSGEARTASGSSGRAGPAGPVPCAPRPPLAGMAGLRFPRCSSGGTRTAFRCGCRSLGGRACRRPPGAGAPAPRRGP